MIDRLQAWVPRLVLAPSFLLILLFVYGFIAYTGYLSMTDSRMLPSYGWVGFENYTKLFNLRHWKIALNNLAIFGILYIGICSCLGLALAILLDQKIRAEGVIRPIYLYPMALSFIVTGTAWKWFLDPGIGLESIMHSWGWASFEFRWIKDRNFAIYTVVIAAVWQSSGFVMAMFLAGLRGVDNEIIKAAQMDGASTWTVYRRIIIPLMRPVFLSAFVVLAHLAGLRGVDNEIIKAAQMDGASIWTVYRRIIIPLMRPVFLSAFVVLAHLAIKAYDLVVALTGGGPGQATELPATFMYSYTFTRNQMGIGASSAIIMLIMIFSIIIPYLYSELRGSDQR